MYFYVAGQGCASVAIMLMIGPCHEIIWTAKGNLNDSSLINRDAFLFFT
jgi:hypothetical protein